MHFRQVAFSSMQIQNEFSFYFLNPGFQCEAICKERLTVFEMRGFSLVLCPIFFVFPLMILLFLTAFSGVSVSLGDKEASQKAFPHPDTFENKSNINLLSEKLGL